jgi:hypothetical protein
MRGGSPVWPTLQWALRDHAGYGWLAQPHPFCTSRRLSVCLSASSALERSRDRSLADAQESRPDLMAVTAPGRKECLRILPRTSAPDGLASISAAIVATVIQLYHADGRKDRPLLIISCAIGARRGRLRACR